jgi:hypothetical protein
MIHVQCHLQFKVLENYCPYSDQKKFKTARGPKNLATPGIESSYSISKKKLFIFLWKNACLHCFAEKNDKWLFEQEGIIS